MTSNARHAYETHLAALATQDLDAIVSGYRDDAVLASNAGIGQGHDYIRTVFSQFLGGGNEITPRSQVFEQDDVVYVTWTADTGDGAISGADTFVVRDGLIAVHSGFIASPH